MPSACDRSSGFAPLARSDARVLILGSLPSQRSISRNEYYAHPQNAFWPIMAAIASAEGSYENRSAALQQAGIAVWDVLASSVRRGSLDADIQMSTAEVNNFEAFFAAHRAIRRVLFNGQKAAKIFAERVPQDLVEGRIQLFTLPSTSPAHAAMSLQRKLELWQAAISAV
jgi:hypoxanthine-DNA glycosylase